MLELKIATRQCTDPKGKLRRFHYFLTVDQDENACYDFENYGVSVLDEAGGRADIPDITTSATRIDELMTMLVDNLVGPTALPDVVADWL
jgi:hypothetical protein